MLWLVMFGDWMMRIVGLLMRCFCWWRIWVFGCDCGGEEFYYDV